MMIVCICTMMANCHALDSGAYTNGMDCAAEESKVSVLLIHTAASGLLSVTVHWSVCNLDGTIIHIQTNAAVCWFDTNFRRTERHRTT